MKEKAMFWVVGLLPIIIVAIWTLSAIEPERNRVFIPHGQDRAVSELTDQERER